MQEDIFRKKSIERVKSPESLDSYIQVSNPGVWLLLVSVILLLAGVCVWGVFGHIDSTLETNVHAERGAVVCTVSDAELSSVREGLTVKFGGYEAVITEIGQEDGAYVCALQSEQVIPDGFYEGRIVRDSIKPLSFVLN